MLGPGGVLAAREPPPLVADMSSIEPGVSRKIAAAAAARGVSFVDAPVSGGEPGAVAGELAIMAGGGEAAFEALRPLFAVLGKSAVHCGAAGAGNAVKLANQMIVAANIQAVGEALVFAVRSGLDPGVVVEAIRGGLAGSAVLHAKAPKMIAGDWKPGFRLELHLKDPRQRPRRREGSSESGPGDHGGPPVRQDARGERSRRRGPRRDRPLLRRDRRGHDLGQRQVAACGQGAPHGNPSSKKWGTPSSGRLRGSPPDGGPNRLRDPLHPLSRGGRTLPASLPGGALRRVGARGCGASIRVRRA